MLVSELIKIYLTMLKDRIIVILQILLLVVGFTAVVFTSATSIAK